MRRILLFVIILPILIGSVKADTIRWVDFQVPYESMKYAMEQDIATFEEEDHIDWIDVLALSACRTGGKCDLPSVKKAFRDLKQGTIPEELLGESYKYYAYYHEAYSAVLGGMLGSFAIEKDGQWVPTYGLKAFSPIAAGFGYSHCDDFGADRSFGFKRRHLGNDLMGSAGTPIVAVEAGVVEALGWNRYGGWRIGIRSFDSRRYYYYAHLQKDAPFAPGLAEGEIVEAGQLLGFMGRTGYSDTENVNNIETVHLHFGMQLVFDESQKECDSEIWIDVYDIVKLLSAHRASYRKINGEWQRVYPFRDLDEREWNLRVGGDAHIAPKQSKSIRKGRCGHRSLLRYFHNSQHIFLHRKPDIKSRKGQTVDPVGFSLVRGTGIMGQDTDGGAALILRQN